MKDIRRSQEYKQWKNAVRHRDGSACRRCGFEKNLHVHHIKPVDRYPQFALEIENGLTLCGNCHSILSGKEETTDLRLFLEGETKIDQQLRAIERKFSTYLERKLRSGIERTREEEVRALFRHLGVYSNSFSEMVQHLVFVVDSDEWADESPTKRRAIEWLSQTISGEEVECTSCQGKVRIPFRKARIRQPNEKIDVAQLDDQKLEQLAELIESGVITDNALKRAVQETATARTKEGRRRATTETSRNANGSAGFK